MNEITKELALSVASRFWAKVSKTDSCWCWTGGTQGRGYGAMHVGPKAKGRHMIRAHRLSWVLHNAEIPNDLWVLHKCDNPQCVNPDHLFLGDRIDNMKDAAKKGRITTIGQSRKTHCVAGHEFTPENTYTYPKGHRKCRQCITAERIQRRARNRAALSTPKESPPSVEEGA